MDCSYVVRHIKSLTLAKECVELGARTKTVSYITGLDQHELRRMFFVDEQSAPRGRAPESEDWYLQPNLIKKVEASVFASLFARIHRMGFSHPDALVGAYRAYLERCSCQPRINFDRAFDLVCHLYGIWLKSGQRPDMCLKACALCSSQYIALIGDCTISDGDCPFCKLVKRYSYDKRLQDTFPMRVPPRSSRSQVGLLTPITTSQVDITAKEVGVHHFPIQVGSMY